jgi:23S rRNA pseudouridine2457 synthase
MVSVYQYYKIYKPYLMLSQFSKGENDKSLADLKYHFPGDVYPVGRLDADSEGLLILTNDKSLNSKLFDVHNPHPRTYLVEVEGAFSQKEKSMLEKGIEINLKGTIYKTLPSAVEILDSEPLVPPRNPPIRFRKTVPVSWIKITLYEGKNRQIRRMTAAVGFPTLRLIRIAIGNIRLDNLQPGDVEIIDIKEINKLLNFR